VRDEGRRIQLHGTVQGVGLRPWVYRLARDVGVRGSVRNAASGVTIEAYGSGLALERFIDRLGRDVPPPAAISRMLWHSIAPSSEPAFRIEPSEQGGRRSADIPADLPTCGDCLREIFDPRDRRFGYAFTTCTSCGPRFTIARSIPYDRANTSMAAFAMCSACRAEYETPESRRFHAEANACPRCGPSLELLDPSGARRPVSDPLATAADALADGRIVAIKGLGGYHLACDARDERAVATLRRRKHREAKPFAVMVGSLADAESLVELVDPAARMLTGRERPIVLLPRRPSSPIAPAVAAGEGRLGVFLPYTPLHHLLLAAVARPLVMTSANLADEPTAHRDDQALARLADVADLFLAHDREITTRTDDSVAAVVAGAPQIIRRSRGYVPRPLGIEATVVPGGGRAPVVLGCGAHLKNACCLLVGDEAYLGPHIGDLETFESGCSMVEAIATMERLLDVRAEVVAHDLHPDYLSSSHALERAAVEHVAVQHHHAHVAAVMCEHGLSGPVLGLAWDGTGLGTDRTIWGSELLLADYERFVRLATFRPIRLPGGDLAMREVWRSALAVLDDAYDGEPPLDRLRAFDGIDSNRIGLVRRMLAARLNAPTSHGMGRWFDATAAIALGIAHADYEGQLAVRWEQVAGGLRAEPYSFRIDTAGVPWQVDLRSTVREVVADTLADVDVETISARFHATVVAAASALLRRAMGSHGSLPVVAGGGCFHNGLLVEGLQDVIAGAGPGPLYRNVAVPAGDGGIALGQACVARARHRAGPLRA